MIFNENASLYHEECCSADTSVPNTLCLKCRQVGTPVSSVTPMRLLTKEVQRRSDHLRVASVVVGLKEGAKPSIICYCFGRIKEDINAQIQAAGTSSAYEGIKTKM